MLVTTKALIQQLHEDAPLELLSNPSHSPHWAEAHEVKLSCFSLPWAAELWLKLWLSKGAVPMASQHSLCSKHKPALCQTGPLWPIQPVLQGQGSVREEEERENREANVNQQTEVETAVWHWGTAVHMQLLLPLSRSSTCLLLCSRLARFSVGLQDLVDAI